MYENNSYNETPLNSPLYGASFGQAIKRFFKKYARFSGYASRSEYWWTVLFLFLIMLIPSVFSNIGDKTDSIALNIFGVIFSIIYLIMGLATLIPSLSVTWRRLHDAGFSGAYFFLSFIPLIGWIPVLVMTLLPSNPAARRPEWSDNSI